VQAEPMSDVNEVISLYKSSSFYKKYKDTYFSDIILRDALKCKITIHRYYGLSKMSYEDVHRLSTDVLRDLLNGFAKEVDFNDIELFWKMIHAFYIDLDSKGLRELNGIQCTADGLFSICRIYKKNGIDNLTVEEYDMYRKKPIFFFPRELNGINSRRHSVFGDRIDYTLYDIKLYLDAKTEEERNQCKLISTYKLPKTKIWLEKLGTFKNLVDWYGIEGIFVNDNYDVYDIERGNGKVISAHLDKYDRDWSENYYRNLQEYVVRFIRK
jgi:hypothetical protein